MSFFGRDTTVFCEDRISTARALLYKYYEVRNILRAYLYVTLFFRVFIGVLHAFFRVGKVYLGLRRFVTKFVIASYSRVPRRIVWFCVCDFYVYDVWFLYLVYLCLLRILVNLYRCGNFS